MFFIIWLVVFSVWIVGLTLGALAARKLGADGTFAKIVGYSNLVMWLFPIIGFFTAAATLGVAKQSMHSAQKLRIMSAICSFASIINFGAGVLLHHSL
ncbi:MAG TPA: hypothetical protein V6C81_13575 [Planktothrix sp.]|jgi:hypothetical protein